MTNPRQTTVIVTLKSVDLATRTGKFILEPVGSDPLPPPTGPHQELLFENNKHDGVDIEFVLIDATNQQYTFPPAKKLADAVSSELGATDLCPKQGTSDVLIPKSINGPNNNILRVHNPNQNIPGGPKLTGPFSYVLWVTNDNGKNWIALDPGGQNMNGATVRLSWSAVLVATAIFAVGTVFALGMRRENDR
ncbi:MAG TPA: hypothetical protein VGU01_06105 [Sphingomicrobium sp.]|nr:hypothetical protein [Sphingomicrobium sp.]